MSRSNQTIDTVSASNYAAPTLKVYGDVKALTAAGTAGPSENATGPGTCSNTAGRKVC